MSTPTSLISFIRTEQNLSYGEAAVLTALVYNYLLTLKSEVQLVWQSPWNLGKSLFFLTRYLAFIVMVLGFYLDGSRFMSINGCTMLSRANSFISMVEFYLAETPALAIYFFRKISNEVSDFSAEALKIFGYCPYYSATGDGIVIMFAYLLIYEAAITFLTIYKAMQHIWGSGDAGMSSFVSSFFRDGLSYNVVILVSTAANIIVQKQARPYQDLSFSFQSVIHSIGTSQLLLQLRRQALATSDLSHVAEATSPLESMNFAARHSHTTTRIPDRNDIQSWFGECAEGN
ncbi:hypothetical protein D9758_008984 [Tetrapyrgos nigripes]|uniref:DUF6533 domain-containing protein n=1 Tax=Tetrapyrgos nigripes TaxID=182062 RepID=A0A8H5GKF7_9AGAR|nr:hypothetical protein D9758_008984 [Tetrapyrgos nigripes]